MKRNDVLLMLSFICIAVLIFVLNVVHPVHKEAMLVIKVDDEIYGRYDLHKDQVIQINDSNICEIKDGKVNMIDANCPDQVCVHSISIGKQGGSIICLPNRVFLEIENGEESIDSIAS